MDILADLEVGDEVLIQPDGVEEGCPKCGRHLTCGALLAPFWVRVHAIRRLGGLWVCSACRNVWEDLRENNYCIVWSEGCHREEAPYTWIQEIRREEKADNV